MDDYDRVIQTLSGCKRVIVTTHVRPDGDALGSSAGLILGLRAKGIDAEALLLSHLPTKYSFIYRENEIRHRDVEAGWPADFSLAGFDALIVVDTGTWSQLPGLQERLKDFHKPKVIIDHHLTQQEWADVKLVDTAAGACAEIIATLLKRWNVPIDAKIATSLFLGLVTDTGWFMFSNTRPMTLTLAAELMQAGVNTDRLYQLLYQSERAERIALQTRGLQSLEIVADGKVAVMQLRNSDFIETKAHVNDTENLINLPLQIAAVQVSVLLTEAPEGGPIRVSLRSKGQIDVAKFAESFGGGGHARAAGLKLETSLADARQKVVSRLIEQVR